MSTMIHRKSPKLSILTISLNHARFLRETVDSVFRQKYDHIEYIFIDGESTDGTQDILEEYQHIDWVSEPDPDEKYNWCFYQLYPCNNINFNWKIYIYLTVLSVKGIKLFN